MRLNVFASFLLFSSICHGQKCSYITVPVCGDGEVSISPGILGNGRGAKGEPGPPGKMGPRGLPGKRGDKGYVGSTENCSDFDDFKQEVKRKLNELERIAKAPESCESSYTNGRQPLRNGNNAFCNSRWTVFQRRFNGSVDFNRTWREYKEGFGDLSGEFWWGLEKVHKMSSNRNCRLRIDLRGFDESSAYAHYSSFSVDGERDQYRVHVDRYSGNAGDSFISGHNEMQFTTKDRDNDRYSGNCALVGSGRGGGWWFNNCFFSSLNAAWGRSSGAWTKMIWYAWKGASKALKESLMRLRYD